jgi:hypothetical protein
MTAIPNLNLQATIVANGQVFPGWERIEIWREFLSTFSYMKFRAAENTDGGLIPQAALSLDVGDQATEIHMRSRSSLRRILNLSMPGLWSASRANTSIKH